MRYVGLAPRAAAARMWQRAHICLNRPNACPCNAYEWIHRTGVGKCERRKVIPFAPASRAV